MVNRGYGCNRIYKKILRLHGCKQKEIGKMYNCKFSKKKHWNFLQYYKFSKNKF